MATQTSIVTFNGETVERYKNLVRKNSHKPRLLLQWGHWVCVSHNARGQGDYGDLTADGARWAYNHWYRANRQFLQHQAKTDLY